MAGDPITVWYIITCNIYVQFEVRIWILLVLLHVHTYTERCKVKRHCTCTNLFIIRCLLYHTLTSNRLVSCDLSFIFNCPIICKTVKYSDHLDNSSCHVLGLIPKDLASYRLIAGWSVRSMNPDVTSYRLSFCYCIDNEKKYYIHII